MSAHDAGVTAADHEDQPQEVNVEYLKARRQDIEAAIEKIRGHIEGDKATVGQLKEELSEVVRHLRKAGG
jgi:archaellum component FlaC